MYTLSYLIPAVSGIFQLAMDELPKEDAQLYKNYLENHHYTDCFGILTTHDSSHYDLVEIGPYDELMGDLAKYVADEAEEASVVNCEGKNAGKLEARIENERAFNNAMHCRGRISDLVVYSTDSDNLLQVIYQTTYSYATP